MEKYLIIVFIVYLLAVISGYALEYLNLDHLKKYGSLIPPEFEGHIDQALLAKTRDYVVENTRFDFVSSVFHNAVLVVFLFGNVLGWYDSWSMFRKLPFILSGLIFFLLLLYAETALTIPFKLYHTFKIENKYGFTTMSMKLWVTDFLKSLAITTVLTAIIITTGLFIVQKNPVFWWFWVWCLFLVFSIIIMYIFPYVIEPFFNKFTPLEDEALRDGINSLMQKVGIRVKRVFKMDASKRTKHTNAYFTGIGRVKRIVLYDTLLERMDTSEVLSILAHEAGHWKKRHLIKHLIASEIIALIALFLSHKMLQHNFLADLFGIKECTFFTKVVIAGFLWSIAAFPFAPVFNYFSRRHEYEADRFSCKLTENNRSMTSALVKLSKDNLSNLHPHPLYALFHYSHPPVLKRIRVIREMIQKQA